MKTKTKKIDDYYIYKVTFITDGRTYVGKREIVLWNTPAKGMKKYTPGEYYGSGEHIKNAIKCYGVENFTREIIDEYHDITDTEIRVIESEYIKAEWAAGHGEFNHSANSYGGDMFDGMPDNMKKDLLLKIDTTDRENHGGVRAWNTLSHEERVEINKRVLETLGPEGRSERSRKSAKTRTELGDNNFQRLTHEQRVDNYKKASITNRNKHNGKLPWHDLTPEQLSEKSRKSLATMGPEGIKARNEKTHEKYVFLKDGIYLVKNKAWCGWIKKGYKRLCKFIDWDNYCISNNIDNKLLFIE